MTIVESRIGSKALSTWKVAGRPGHYRDIMEHVTGEPYSKVLGFACRPDDDAVMTGTFRRANRRGSLRDPLLCGRHPRDVPRCGLSNA